MGSENSTEKERASGEKIDETKFQLNSAQYHDIDMDKKWSECQLCLELYEGKIFQCSSGHSFCEQCTSKIDMCPVCRNEMTRIRNYSLEEAVQSMESIRCIPCKNYGCSESYAPEKKSQHQIKCAYRRHVCPMQAFGTLDCGWAGAKSEIRQHVVSAHQANTLNCVTKEMAITCEFVDFKEIKLLNYLGGQEIFFYKHKVDTANEKVYWAFQYLGPKEEADKYLYEFEIGKDMLKYKVAGSCSSEDIDVEELFDTELCVCMSYKQLLHYINENNEIKIRFRVTDFASSSRFQQRKHSTRANNHTRHRQINVNKCGKRLSALNLMP